MQRLFLLNRFFSSPLESLFTLLIFILNKELGASAWQLAVLACAKPVVSLFAFILSSRMAGKPSAWRCFLILCTFLGASPVLLFPYIQNPWYYIASYALFMTAIRASYPIWMEMLKNHYALNQLGSAAAKGSCITFSITTFLPLILARWLDTSAGIFCFLFFSLACLNLLNIPLLLLLKPDFKTAQPVEISWTGIVRKNRPFAQYLLLFFIGGAGLVAIQPVLPQFFQESLNLSYTKIACAMSLCRGCAFVASSPFWTGWAKSITLFRLNIAINALSCGFLILLFASIGNTHWLYAAYCLYGAMQAGCELSWNLSGPFFAKGEESTLYSCHNLLLVGVRGCIFPFAGQALMLSLHTTGVFICAGALCFAALCYGIWLERRCHDPICI
jgi:hypothetical protein